MNPAPSLALRMACAAALVSGGLLSAGCEPADPDRGARAQLTEAYAFRTGGDVELRYAGLADEAAAGASGPATQTLAHELVGNVALERAAVLQAGPIMDGEDPQPGLLSTQTRIMLLAEEATSLANAIALGQVYVQSERRKNPEAALQSARQTVQEIRSSAEGWSPGEDVDVRLLSMQQAREQANELQQRIEQLNQQINQLEEQRAQQMRQASQLDQESERLPSQQALQAYRQVADLRTRAADIATQITGLRWELQQAEADLQKAQVTAQSLEETISALDAQQQTLASTWEGIQQQISRLQAANQNTYTGGGEPPTPRSVQALAEQIQTHLTRMEELQGQTQEQLEKASNAFQTARSRASGAAGAAQPLFRTAISAAFDTNRMRLAEAVSARQLGMMHASAAVTHASLHRLQQTLQDGGEQLPASLQIDPAARYRSEIESAAESLMEADETLMEVIQGAQGALAQEATTQRAVLLSNMLALHSLMEATGVQTQAQLMSRQQLSSDIQRTVNLARQNQATLPLVPGFLGLIPTTPTPEPEPEEPAPEEGEEVMPDDDVMPDEDEDMPGDEPGDDPDAPGDDPEEPENGR